jgi:hypothetical protein
MQKRIDKNDETEPDMQGGHHSISLRAHTSSYNLQHILWAHLAVFEPSSLESAPFFVVNRVTTSFKPRSSFSMLVLLVLNGCYHVKKGE